MWHPILIQCKNRKWKMESIAKPPPHPLTPPLKTMYLKVDHHECFHENVFYVNLLNVQKCTETFGN